MSSIDKTSMIDEHNQIMNLGCVKIVPSTRRNNNTSNSLMGSWFGKAIGLRHQNESTIRYSLVTKGFTVLRYATVNKNGRIE